ncbi:MAG: CPBP family intramembrane metalloprotease [Acidimicrobiia bacterium]|nr:CPBP family intramembrane metalloprotease [Acidimicrobiia bacterium]
MPEQSRPPAAAAFGPGGGRAVVFGLVSSVFLTSVVAQVAISAGDYDTTTSSGTGFHIGRVLTQRVVEGGDAQPIGFPLWLTALLQIPLWVGLMTGVVVFSRQQRGSIRDLLGFHMEPLDAVRGMAVGIVAQLVLVPALYVPIFWIIGDQDVSAAARSLTDRADSRLGVVLLVLTVVVGAPIVEELFFRGLVLRTFERHMHPLPAIVLAAVLFGAVHLQLLQFPALMLFGFVAGVMAHRFGRLGPSIWAHVGFNLVTVLVLLGQ